MVAPDTVQLKTASVDSLQVALATQKSDLVSCFSKQATENRSNATAPGNKNSCVAVHTGGGLCRLVKRWVVWVSGSCTAGMQPAPESNILRGSRCRCLGGSWFRWVPCYRQLGCGRGYENFFSDHGDSRHRALC